MATVDQLLRALEDQPTPFLRPLPRQVAELLLALGSPPRLAAHLRAVHDVAHQIVEWTVRRYPGLDFDQEAVFFGAATHDIGKTAHPAELSGPGSHHERAGRQLLLERGVNRSLARFAATHAAWSRLDPDDPAALEDLLVSLSDKVWKNKRVVELENLLVSRLAELSGRQPWEEFLPLDDLLTEIGAGAEARLDYQASFPLTR